MPPPSKKRKTHSLAPEKVNFDFAAREEYLTGFHKRKQARIKLAQEEAAKKEKEERLRIRRQMRQQRREDLERHVSEVNRLVKQANGDLDPASTTDAESNSEWEGIQDSPPSPDVIDEEEEYVDEDKYTTVTIETVGISKQGFEKRGGGEEDDDGEAEGHKENGEVVKKKREWTKEKPRTDRPKKKKRKFRYETKAERKAERVKQGMKKRKQAQARKAD